ncbi:MAG: NAD(P)H-binding protein [Gammaproteobacteria bacterium]
MSYLTFRRSILGFLIVLVSLAGARAIAEEPAEVLVFGGTGQLGTEIVQRLVARGDQVTVYTRSGSDRSLLDGMPVKYIEGDLMKPAEVTAAFKHQHFDAVIIAVRVEDGDIHFYEKGLTPLVAAAKATGVGRIIHSSAVGAGANVQNFQNLGWEKVPGLLDRLKDQGVGEALVRNSGIPWTIIRNTRVYPAGTPATGKAVLTEDGTVIDPLTRADLAALTVGCLADAACIGKTYHVRDPSLTWPPPQRRAP